MRLKLISDLSITITLIMAIYLKIQKRVEKDFSSFVLFIFIASCFTCLQMLSEIFFDNNLWLCHLYTPIEGAFLSYFMLYQIDKNKALAAGILIWLVCQSVDLGFSGFESTEILASIIEYVLLIIAAIPTIIEIYRSNLKFPLINYKFLISLTILMYALISLTSTLLMFSNLFAGYIIYAATSLLINLFFAIALGIGAKECPSRQQ